MEFFYEQLVFFMKYEFRIFYCKTTGFFACVSAQRNLLLSLTVSASSIYEQHRYRVTGDTRKTLIARAKIDNSAVFCSGSAVGGLTVCHDFDLVWRPTNWNDPCIDIYAYNQVRQIFFIRNIVLDVWVLSCSFPRSLMLLVSFPLCLFSVKNIRIKCRSIITIY